MSNINVYDKIVIENQKRRKYGNKMIKKNKSSSNIWFRNGIHSLLSRADARKSADLIYGM